MAKIKSEILDEDDNEIHVVCYFDDNADPQISENGLKYNVTETTKTFTKEAEGIINFISTSDKELVKPKSTSNINKSGPALQCEKTKTLKYKIENVSTTNILEDDAENEEQEREFISCMPALTCMELSVHQPGSNSKINKNECNTFHQSIETKSSIEKERDSIGFENEKEEGKSLLVITPVSTSMELLSKHEDLNRHETKIKKVNRGVKKKEHKRSTHKTNEDGNEICLTCTSPTAKKRFKSNTVTRQKCKRDGNVNQYIKTKVLNAMLENGCSSDVFNEIIRNFKASPSKIKETLNVTVKEAQDFVYQECDSLSFHNIKAWLEYFQATNTNEHCSYELAIVMNAIGQNELHPQPDDLGGINLKALYKFLSNALMGLPQPPLDNKSRAFLIEEFENIVNEANTEMGDLDTLNMRNQLFANCNSLPDTTSSLNPLKLNI